ILLAASTTLIGLEVGGRNLVHRIQDEMDNVLLGNPLAQIAGQKHRCLAVQVDKTRGHVDPILAAPLLFNLFQKYFWSKPDRLLALPVGSAQRDEEKDRKSVV